VLERVWEHCEGRYICQVPVPSTIARYGVVIVALRKIISIAIATNSTVSDNIVDSAEIPPKFCRFHERGVLPLPPC